ncbi:chaps-domain-containing protein [Laetiporus sulphureus 93-53]|uniref:Chaps-domain-containing protein n=1 Tax=Laetiporus sulphureus 93-53 TaxID=1314785 RepID=A0A165BB39_9APHY|nr:chaps-domain-containing protein [Laetiporus sulphureus 93-53]KZT00654.1 chaps-domain-containing protein [Laetiporus sulphureus 93-53]
MADASFKDVPEIFEVELGESVAARTEALSTWRELGPPDLCHVIKSTGRSGQHDLGSYHYVSGVDASSSASLAAYINSLTYAIEDDSGWFSKGSAWKVRHGCYCCFNAFSRVDVRVDVKIPGGVNAYIIDLRGERHELTADAGQDMWQETYLSAILRAVLYSDDSAYWLDAYRKLDPITTPEGELRFLQSAEALFMKGEGWQVGSEPEIQVATVVSNHLTSAIMKYFGDSGRYQYAANLFEKLSAKEPEISSLLARSYIGMNEEVKAVQIMAAAIKQTPQSYTLLHAQCDLLRSKGNHEWALKLAKQAVNCAPSEFVTWEKLTELYIDLKQYESALLTLNSCPMFTYNGRDAHRNLQASKVHLPPKGQIVEILPERAKTEDDDADPALLRLPAPGLRGTWARAYALLTRLVSQIGWDELLKTRSSVFVMEEEYRMQKQQGDMRGHSTSPSSANGQVPARGSSLQDSATLVQQADDDASTRAVVSPVHSANPSAADTRTDADTLGVNDGLPTIRISTASDVERDKEAIIAMVKEKEREEAEAKAKAEAEAEVEAKAKAEAEAEAAASNKNEPDANTNGEAKQNGVSMSHSLEKPEQAAAGAGDGSQEGEPPSSMSNQEPFSFSNKRLCERWLDNLFMVLYEDLRVWTIFRAEVAHFKTQHVAYRKTALEWEILGDLGSRLHHKEEAKEAYTRCLDSPRYSYKPWSKLLDMYADEGDIQRTLQVAIRVAAYQWGEYAEMTYPTQIARCLFKVGQIHGHAKISYTLLSMGLPDSIAKIMEGYLNYGKTFKVEGYDF